MAVLIHLFVQVFDIIFLNALRLHGHYELSIEQKVFVELASESYFGFFFIRFYLVHARF